MKTQRACPSRERLYSTGEVATLLGIPISTQSDWERRGYLLPYKHVGKHRRYGEMELRRLLQVKALTARYRFQNEVLEALARGEEEILELPAKLAAEHGVTKGDASPGADWLLGVISRGAELVDQQRSLSRALSASEERYRRLLEKSPDLILSAGVNGCINYVSPAVRRYGYEPAQLIGKSFTALLLPELGELGPGHPLATCPIERGTLQFPLELTAADGRTKFSLEITVIPQREGGHVVGYTAVGRDITDRLRAEKALQESEKRFRALAENATDVIFRIRLHPDVQYEYISPSIFRLIGRTPQEFYADPRVVQKATHPEDLHKLLRLLDGTYDFDQPLELRALHKSGRVVWCEQTLTPIVDNEGKLVAIEGIVRDITQRVIAVERARSKASLLDTVGQAVIATDLGGHITYWGKAAETMYGWTASEVLGLSFQEVSPTLASADQLADILLRLQAGDTWSGELTAERKDGSVFPVLMTAAPILDEAARMIGVVGVSTDITYRKQAEELLAESEKRFRRLFEESPLGAAIVSLDLRYLKVNRELCRITGYSESELTSLGPREITHPEDWPLDEAKYERLLAGQVESQPLEKRYIRKDGSVAWVRVWTQLMTEDDGQPLFWMPLMEDISDHKRMQEAQRLAEEQCRLIIDQLPIGAAVVSLDYRIKFVNEAMASFLGYSPKELIGLSIREVTLPEQFGAALEQAQRLLSGEIPAYQAERFYVRKDGTLARGRLSLRLIRDSTGQPIFWLPIVEGLGSA